MIKKLLILAVWAMVVPGILVGCGSTPEPEPTEPPKEEMEGLWYPLAGEPSTLDAQLGSDTTSQLVIGQLIEGLFEYRGDGSIESAGAIEYWVSEDGLVYTISLREDAVWSDGVPVVAQHYVDGVIRLLKPETAAEYAWLMYDVEGADAFNMGESDDPSTVGIRAVDDHTLQVTLAAPTPYFETVLPFSVFCPVRLDIIEQYGDAWTEPGNYVSNGPYLLDAWERGMEMVLVKNPVYWGADAVKIEKITFPIVLKAAERLELYENDKLHISDWSSEDMSRVLEDPLLSRDLHILPRPGVYYLGLNTLRAPTDNALVRKALAAAIDREYIIEDVIQRPWREPLSCTTPPNIMAHQPYGTCGYAFDLEAAKQYLAEAGYPDGKDFPPLYLWVNQAEFNEGIIGAVAAMWEKHLGITVELRTEEWASYLDYLDQCAISKKDLKSCEMNAYRMGWVMDYGDPQNQLEVVFAPGSTFQYTGWESERFEELMELAGSEFDTAKRTEYYKEADAILCEEQVAVIPLLSYDRSILVKEGVVFDYPPFSAPAFKHWALP